MDVTSTTYDGDDIKLQTQPDVLLYRNRYTISHNHHEGIIYDVLHSRRKHKHHAFAHTNYFVHNRLSCSRTTYIYSKHYHIVYWHGYVKTYTYSETPSVRKGAICSQTRPEKAVWRVEKSFSKKENNQSTIWIEVTEMANGSSKPFCGVRGSFYCSNTWAHQPAPSIKLIERGKRQLTTEETFCSTHSLSGAIYYCWTLEFESSSLQASKAMAHFWDYSECTGRLRMSCVVCLRCLKIDGGSSGLVVLNFEWLYQRMLLMI